MRQLQNLGRTPAQPNSSFWKTAFALSAFGESLPPDTSNLQLKTHNSQTFYTGKPRVPGLGHAFLFRNYRASLARWQTADPLGYPDGWNRLAYCEGDSLNFVDYGGAHRVPVSGNGYILTLAGFGFSFGVQVWGECGGLEHPYISIQSDYYGNAVSFAIDDFSIIVSSFTITEQNHGWEHTISGGVSIWANFTILLELIYISTDENGNEESGTITSSIRHGEFHCDHQKNIFE